MVTSASAIAGLRFGALGTEVLVVSLAAEQLASRLRALVAEYEARFSRFLPESELQQLCRASGTEVTVSDDMFEILSLALGFWRETAGIFDPLIRPELEAAGYDRTFSAVPREIETPATPAPGASRTSFGSVRLDADRHVVLVPQEASLDLGGIGKGWILDRVGAFLSSHGPFLADMGGDMVARSNGPDGGPGWLITVVDPFAPGENLCWLRLRDCAIATSTTMRRRWRRGHRWLHHLIDPRTGAPAESDVVQATVVAPTAVEADVYAKTALIMGREPGLEWLEERSLPALLVMKSARFVTTPQWRSYETPMSK